MRTNGPSSPPSVRLPRFTCPPAATCQLTVQQQADCPPPGLPPWTHDTDEYDIKVDDAATAPPSIVGRTNYSTDSDNAWTAFRNALHDAERKFFTDQAPPTVTVENGEGSEDEDDDASTDSRHSYYSRRSPTQRASEISRPSVRWASSSTLSKRTTRGQPAAGGVRGAAQHRLSGLRGSQ